MRNSIIELKSADLTLGNAAASVHVLKSIDLSIAESEAVGIVGPSGSGKSTLLMVLAGLERLDSGEIHVRNTPLHTLSEDRLADFRGKNIGIVFQSFHLIPTMTALENVAVPLELMGDTPDSFEPDGLPNPIGLTISTYRGNIVYYHAQTSFATGDYQTVVDGMAKSLALAADFARDDMRVPTAYWTYIAYRKMGEHAKARAAIDAAIGLGFGINYQANLTAWGAAACMRLWRITNRDVYRDQSYVYLASFFHNSEIWESALGHAVHYRNFLGVTCLQDAPYMAIYECFDSFSAFEHYLDDSGPDLEPAARMLISEYCKYALDRAWFYYPDALPPEVIASEQRENNGHIDRGLAFPLEDLYPDGQAAGQVGQEIYGAGAAFVFATRAFHRIEDAPFLLYCDHFVRAMERTYTAAVSITLDGGETCIARLSVVRAKRRKLPQIHVATVDGDVLRPNAASADRIDYFVPANGRLVLRWKV